MAMTTRGPMGALRSVLRPLGARAARAYVAGPSLADALEAGRRAASRGFAMALGYWDGGEPPRQVADTYARALDGMTAAGLEGYLSIKAPALRFSRELLGEILARGGRRGARVHFDALRPETAGPTFALMASAAPGHPVALGCTLPARWHRSAADAEEALALGLSVRLVKGEEPGVDGRDVDPRRGMLALVDRLAGRARHVAVATHDAPLAGWRCPGCAPPGRRVRWSSCSGCRSGGRSARRATWESACGSTFLTDMPACPTGSRRREHIPRCCGGRHETYCGTGSGPSGPCGSSPRRPSRVCAS